MALLTLARNAALVDVLEHRFGRGHLQGHALGNLFLVALAEQEAGSFVPALRRAATLLDCQGEVLPSTTEPVQLHAREAGRRVDGQARVARTPGRVERLWLEPRAPAACPAAVNAIHEADSVLLAPGSLFTSVIANLLVPQVGAAVAASAGQVVYVANLRTQPGETAGLDLAAHVDALLDHLAGRGLDAVIVHDGPEPDGPGAPLGPSLAHARVSKVVHADVAARDRDGRPGAGHDEARLAAVLDGLLGTQSVSLE